MAKMPMEFDEPINTSGVTFTADTSKISNVIFAPKKKNDVIYVNLYFRANSNITSGTEIKIGSLVGIPVEIITGIIGSAYTKQIGSFYIANDGNLYVYYTESAANAWSYINFCCI